MPLSTLLNFSVNDLSTLAPAWASVSRSDSNSFTLTLIFDSFNKTLYYDPTLSVTLAGEGDGNNDAIYIGVIVSVGGAIVVTMVIMAAGAAYLAYRRWAMIRRVSRLSGLQQATQGQITTSGSALLR